MRKQARRYATIMGCRVLHEVYFQKTRVGPSWKSSTTPPTVAGPHQPSSCPCPCGSMPGTALGRARATRLLVSWTRPTSARRARAGSHNQRRSQRFEPAALSAFNAHERLESRDLSRQARPIPGLDHDSDGLTAHAALTLTFFACFLAAIAAVIRSKPFRYSALTASGSMDAGSVTSRNNWPD